MEVVTQVKSLSMKFCLDCHRNPEPHIRDPQRVTELDLNSKMTNEEREAYGKEWAGAEKLNIKTNISCSTCHR